MGFLKSLANFFGFGKTNEENSEISTPEEVVNTEIETVVEKQVDVTQEEINHVESTVKTVGEIKSNSKKNKSETPSESTNKPKRPRRKPKPKPKAE